MAHSANIMRQSLVESRQLSVAELYHFIEKLKGQTMLFDKDIGEVPVMLHLLQKQSSEAQV